MSFLKNLCACRLPAGAPSRRSCPLSRDPFAACSCGFCHLQLNSFSYMPWELRNAPGARSVAPLKTMVLLPCQSPGLFSMPGLLQGCFGVVPGLRVPVSAPAQSWFCVWRVIIIYKPKAGKAIKIQGHPGHYLWSCPTWSCVNWTKMTLKDWIQGVLNFLRTQIFSWGENIQGQVDPGTAWLLCQSVKIENYISVGFFCPVAYLDLNA